MTGILVEEALNSRGVLNSSIDKISLKFFSDNNDMSFVSSKSLNNEEKNKRFSPNKNKLV